MNQNLTVLSVFRSTLKIMIEANRCRLSAQRIPRHVFRTYLIEQARGDREDINIGLGLFAYRVPPFRFRRATAGEPEGRSARISSCGEVHPPRTDTIHNGWPRWLVRGIRWGQNIFLLHPRNSRHAWIQCQPIEARKRNLASNLFYARAIPSIISHTLHRKDLPSATWTNFQLEHSRFCSELQVSEVGHNLGIGNHRRAVSC